MYFDGIYIANNMNQDQTAPQRSDCSLRSSLIMVHSVCFYKKIVMNAFEYMQRTYFLDKNISRIRVEHEQDANVSVACVMGI